MSAFIKLVVIDQIGISLLCPTPRRGIYLIRKHADGNWGRDIFDVKEPQLVLPMKARRRNPGPHIGKIYDRTGPQSLTMTQYAQEFSSVLGRPIKYVNVPPEIWEAKLKEAQLPAHLIAHLNNMGQLHRDNRFDRMTDSFQQVVGRAPISAAEFARRHADVFTPQSAPSMATQ
jgi:hypothetical protein